LSPSLLLSDHGITGGIRPLRSSSPIVNPTPPCLLNHVLKCHIYTVFEPLQGWGLHHCPGQPAPRPDHSCSKEIFPNIQSEPPLTQLEAIASRPITGYLGEETNSHLTTPSCQAVVEMSCRVVMMQGYSDQQRSTSASSTLASARTLSVVYLHLRRRNTKSKLRNPRCCARPGLGPALRPHRASGRAWDLRARPAPRHRQRRPLPASL